MIKTLRVLTTLLILTIGSGCSLLRDNLREPLCLPERPTLSNLSVDEQQDMDKSTLLKVALNDRALKDHIILVEAVTKVHNKQFKAGCYDDEDTDD